MNRRIPGIIVVVAFAMQGLCSSVALAEPEDAAAPPAPAAADKPVALTVRVLPQSIQMSSYVSFDQNGKPQQHNQNFSMSLSLIPEPAPGPAAAPAPGGAGPAQAEDLLITACRNIVIDRLVTDAGEQLKIDPQQMPREMEVGRDFFNANARQGRGGNPAVNRFNLSINLPLPTLPCRSLAVISGNVDIEYAVGPVKQAALEQVGNLMGKRISIAGIPGSVVMLSRPVPEKLRMDISRSALRLLSGMRIVDAQGRDLSTPGWESGGGGPDGMIYRTFNLTMPDDGRVYLDFYKETKTQRVPFILRDVIMPRGPEVERVDMVIELGEPKAPGPIEGAAPGGGVQLKVEVEGG